MTEAIKWFLEPQRTDFKLSRFELYFLLLARVHLRGLKIGILSNLIIVQMWLST